MKFATIGHLLLKSDIKQFPKSWIHEELIVSPEVYINGTSGYIVGLTLTARQIMQLPKETVRKKILDAAVFIQKELNKSYIYFWQKINLWSI